jgi:hypothetical protein
MKNRWRVPCHVGWFNSVASSFLLLVWVNGA